MKGLLFIILWYVSYGLAQAQYTKPLINYQPDTAYTNVHVQKIADSQEQSTFIIWVKENVKAHYHAWHTEHIVVISGEAWMRLGSDSLHIKPGVHIYIPKGTVHSVYHVLGTEPLKVLSIQSPKFDGEDRIWADE